MSHRQSWAQSLTLTLITRMKRVQIHAAYRVQRKGGHQVAQACAAVAARDSLLDGLSAASAIANGIAIGMRINSEVNTIHYLH